MFPIKYMENNLVFNQEGECFAYYELVPYNYSFLSPEQKMQLQDSFRQLVAQSRDGRIHALQLAAEHSIRSVQEQCKKEIRGELRETAEQIIDEQTEALVDVIGENQIDYRFFLGFKLQVTEQEFSLRNVGKNIYLTITEFIREVSHSIMGDFVRMDNDEIERFQKVEKLLEDKIARRFKVKRVNKNDLGYIIEHIYGMTGMDYEAYEYYLPTVKLPEATLVKKYDLIKPIRCLVTERQRFLEIDREERKRYVTYFTINEIVRELDQFSSEMFYYQQSQLTFPVDTSMNIEVVANKKALFTVRNKKKELKDLDDHAYSSNNETSNQVVDALESVDQLEADLDQTKEPPCIS